MFRRLFLFGDECAVRLTNAFQVGVFSVDGLVLVDGLLDELRSERH